MVPLPAIDLMNNLTEQLRTERHAVETFYRAFNDNQPDLVDTVLAPTWEDIPMAPGQAPGPAGIKDIIAMLAASFADMRITLVDMVQEPGKIAVRADISGIHQGTLFGIAPTGKHVRFGLHEFHALADGRVTTTWHMEDWLALFQQLGQFPPAA
jgi:predicted ester cyclase